MTTDIEVPTATGPQAAHDVTIVPASSARALPALTPHLFRLSFPVRWRSPYPQGNVYSGAFHQATVDWLSRFSLVKDDHDRALLDNFACGWYGGLSSPRSNFVTA